MKSDVRSAQSALRVTMKSYLGLSAVLLSLLPTALLAQVAETGSISGVVTDPSGKAIPGVTVTAASPALIQGTLSAITDNNGAYRIIELRPGTYSVTFMAMGFTTIRRDGLALTAGFNATESASLQVGALTQTVLVADQAPVVDTQNVSTNQVFNSDAVLNIPSGQSQKISHK